MPMHWRSEPTDLLQHNGDTANLPTDDLPNRATFRSAADGAAVTSFGGFELPNAPSVESVRPTVPVAAHLPVGAPRPDGRA